DEGLAGIGGDPGPEQAGRLDPAFRVDVPARCDDRDADGALLLDLDLDLRVVARVEPDGAAVDEVGPPRAPDDGVRVVVAAQPAGVEPGGIDAGERLAADPKLHHTGVDGDRLVVGRAGERRAGLAGLGEPELIGGRLAAAVARQEVDVDPLRRPLRAP